MGMLLLQRKVKTIAGKKFFDFVANKKNADIIRTPEFIELIMLQALSGLT